jgi:hypothetical protein
MYADLPFALWPAVPIPSDMSACDTLVKLAV